MAYDMVVCGHLCLDLLPDMENVSIESLAVSGKLFETGAMQISTGGAVSNTGLALHQLGLHVGLMGLVGNDLLGQTIIGFLKNRDVRLGELLTVEPDVPSSYTVVIAPENRDRTFLHCTGTNDVFGVDHINFEVVAQSPLFHLGYPPLLPRLYQNNGDELVAIFRRVHELGVVTSLDMTLPEAQGRSGQADWGTILSRTLPYVDIFIPSIEEILFMLRRHDYDRWEGEVLSHLNATYLDELTAELITMGAAMVGFKMGAMGLYLRTTSEASAFQMLEGLIEDVSVWTDIRTYHPAFEVEVAGTTGAGDAAYAGFLAALYRQLPPQDCVRWACALGACNVEAADATSGVQSWEATRRRLASNWQTRSLILPGADTFR